MWSLPFEAERASIAGLAVWRLLVSGVIAEEYGKVKPLAVTGLKRYSLMPQVPTVAESGLPGFEALAWNGVLVPAGTPRPVIERLNREMNAALQAAAVRQKLNAAGLEPVGGTPEQFGRLIRSEAEKWAPVIRRTGAKID